MKTLLWFGLLPLFLSPRVHAENFSSPVLCPAEEASLQAENPTAEPQLFWIQNLGSQPLEEVFVSVKPQGHWIYSLKDLPWESKSALAIKTPAGTPLHFHVVCASLQKSWPLEDRPSPWKTLSLPGPSSELQLEIANLTQQPNPVEITLISRSGHAQTQRWLLGEAFGRQSFKLPLPPDTRQVKIHALGRWSGKAFDSKGKDLSLQEELFQPPLPPAPGTRYFLFQSLDSQNQESFVVPMTDPRWIQESLAQIQNPSKARLLVARIEKSLQGQNWDESSLRHTPWSWQVTEVLAYADFAHISCDGTPGLVEERLNSWMQETGGGICFWSYRIVRELHP